MSRFPLQRILPILIALSLPLAAFAGDPVGKASGNGSSINWQVQITGHERLELIVVSPEGEVFRKDFNGGQNPSFGIKDLGTEVVDGTYNYELRVVPKIPPGVAKKLENARAANDESAARKIMKDAGLSTAVVQSGGFTILNRSIVPTDAVESDANDSVSSLQGVPSDSSASLRGGGVATNDQVIPDDLIVQGSACIGIDCVNNENFGFDTIRMKENNTRIDFTDTSTAAGFPSEDWEIAANDSASGGRNALIISDENTQLMVISAGINANAIFVDSTGRIGFRTSTPVLDLHVSTSNTPGIRLEQTNAGGFTAQTWDVAGNEANFFVRDVTSGSRLPFRIRPGAPTSSLDIAASGKVGIGTGSPGEKLHVLATDNVPTFLVVENTNTGTDGVGVLRAKSDTATVNFQAHGSGRTLSRFGQTLAGWSELLQVSGNGMLMGTVGNTPLILGTNSTARMTIAGTGAITVPGNFTVSGVKNFATVDPADSNNALYYTALEGPEAGTYFRGSAKTVGGEVTIELPGYFARLTESERLTVQLTPIGAPGQLYVASKSPAKLIIKVAEGSPDLEFDYWVSGVRKGYLDYEVERAGAFPVQQ